MVKKVQESKASKREKIAKAQGKRKKWTSGVTKEVVKKNPIIDEETFDKIQKDVGNMKIVTKALLSEKYNINLYVCTNVLSILEEKGVVKKITSGKFKAYGGGKYVPPKQQISVEIEDYSNDSDKNQENVDLKGDFEEAVTVEAWGE